MTASQQFRWTPFTGALRSGLGTWGGLLARDGSGVGNRLLSNVCPANSREERRVTDEKRVSRFLAFV
jgi:hypothetical protein